MLTLFTGLFGKLFSDWRIIAMVILVAVCGFMTVRLKVEQSHLEKAQQTIKIQEVNNTVLKQNVETITKVNAENVKMLGQIKADSVLTTKAVVALNNQLSARDRTVGDLKKKLNDLEAPAQKLSPHIALSVQGIQQLREQAAAAEGVAK